MIEQDEIEEVLQVCAWVHRLVRTIEPALKALEERVEEIEERCRVWEFRLDFQRRGNDED